MLLAPTEVGGADKGKTSNMIQKKKKKKSRTRHAQQMDMRFDAEHTSHLKF